MDSQVVDTKLEIMAFLQVGGRKYLIHNGVNTVGRNRDAVVNLKNLSISQQHAVIVIADGIHYVADIKSSNGTSVSGSKLIPFKLYILEHECELVFGNIGAKYFKQSNEVIFNYDAELSQASTQSLYNAHTQIIHDESLAKKENANSNSGQFVVPVVSIPSTSKEESNIEMLHDAATQVVKWDIQNKSSTSDTHSQGVFSNVINLPPINLENEHIKGDLQISNMQGSEENNIVPYEVEPFGNFFDDSHYEITNDVPEVGNSEDIHSDVHEVQTQVVDLIETYPQNEMSVESQNEKIAEKINSTSQINEEVHIAEVKQGDSVSCTSQESQNDSVQELASTLDSVSTEVTEENSNKIVPDGIACKIDVKEEDSNDSVDFMTLNKPSTSFSSKKSEICIGITNSSENNTEPTNIRNDSQSETSDEIIKPKRKPVNKLDSDSETDIEEDSLINEGSDNEIVNKKRRSVPLPATQDDETNIGDNINKTPESNESDEICITKRKSVPLPATQGDETDIEGNIHIDDNSSECESDVEDSRPKLVEGRTADFIIQDTQDQDNPEDLNDTDCIPPTQDEAALCISKKSTSQKSSSQKSSSEESFKLGLTEMMTEDLLEKVKPSDESNPIQFGRTTKNTESSRLSLSGIDDSLLIKSSENIKSNKMEIRESDEDITDIEDNLDQNKSESEFQLRLSISGNTVEPNPTEADKLLESELIHNQKNILLSNSNECVTELEDPVFHLLPTQPIDEKIDTNEDTKEIKKKKRVSFKEYEEREDTHENNEIYLQPTQKMEEKEIQVHSSNSVLIENTEEENIYIEPTQKLEEEIQQKNDSVQVELVDNDIYLQPTQKLLHDDASTSGHKRICKDLTENLITSNKDVVVNDDIYIQPTQKLGYEENLDEVDLNRRSGIIQDKPSTSKNLISVLSTEKICDIRDDREKPPTPENMQTKMNSKKFTFKKYSLNLDGSLSTILSSGPEKDIDGSETEELTKAMEVKNTEANISADKERPSNPLAVVLDEEKEQNETESVSQIDAFIHTDYAPSTSTFKADKVVANLSTDKGRSSSPLAVVLDEEKEQNETESVSQIDAFIHTDYAPSTSTFKADKVVANLSTDKGRSSNPLSVVLDQGKQENRPSTSSTFKVDKVVDCETLSQIDAFVKHSDKIMPPYESPTLSGHKRSPRKLVQKAKAISFEQLENDLNKTAENLDIEVEKSETPKKSSAAGNLVPASPARDSETISQIDAFIQSSTSKPVIENSRASIAQLFDYDALNEIDDFVQSSDVFLKPTAPSPRRQKRENFTKTESKKTGKQEISKRQNTTESKIKEDESADDIPETISQIDRFIHSSGTKSTGNEGPSSETKHVDHETLSQIDAFIKSTDKWVEAEQNLPIKKQSGRLKKDQMEHTAKTHADEKSVLRKSSRSRQKSATNLEINNQKPGCSKDEEPSESSDIGIIESKSKGIQRYHKKSSDAKFSKREKSNNTLSISEESNIESLGTEEIIHQTVPDNIRTGRSKRNKAVPNHDNNGDDEGYRSEEIKHRKRARKLSPNEQSSILHKPEERISIIEAALSDTTMENSKNEINQSLALLEAKSRKTRKTLKDDIIIQEITLKVPKNRKSMSVSTIEESKMESDIKPLETLLSKGSRTSRRITIVGKKKIANDEVTENTRTSRKRTNTTGREKSNEVFDGSTSTLASTSTDHTTSFTGRGRNAKLRTNARKNKSTELTDSDDGESSSTPSTEPSTPKKQKLIPNESLLLNTAERAKRKLKPKVVFTMLDNPSLESSIRSMGGSIVDSVEKATVLVTEHVKRSQKLLSAVGQGKPICSPQWIVNSKKSHEFLDPWDHILLDKEAEAKWQFSLKESLEKSNRRKLFEDYTFQIIVTAAADVLKGAIESCGGKVVSRCPGRGALENFYVISSAEHKAKHSKMIKQNAGIKVIEPEAIFDGVLRQELRFSRHYLS